MQAYSLFVIMILSSYHPAVESASAAASGSIDALSGLNDDLWEVFKGRGLSSDLFHLVVAGSTKTRGVQVGEYKRVTSPGAINKLCQQLNLPAGTNVILGNDGQEAWGPTDLRQDQLLSIVRNPTKWKPEFFGIFEHAGWFLVMFRKQGGSGINDVVWFSVQKQVLKQGCNALPITTFWHLPLNDIKAPLNLVFDCSTKSLLELHASYQSQIDELERKSLSQIGDLRSDLQQEKTIKMRDLAAAKSHLEAVESEFQDEKRKLILETKAETNQLRVTIQETQEKLEAEKKRMESQELALSQARAELIKQQADSRVALAECKSEDLCERVAKEQALSRENYELRMQFQVMEVQLQNEKKQRESAEKILLETKAEKQAADMLHRTAATEWNQRLIEKEQSIADAQKKIGELGAEMVDVRSQIQVETSQKNQLIKENGELQNDIGNLQGDLTSRQGDLDDVREQLRLQLLENAEANRQNAEEQARVEQELVQQRRERQTAEIELGEERKESDMRWGIASCSVGAVLLVIGYFIVAMKWRAQKEHDEEIEGELIAQSQMIKKPHPLVPVVPSAHAGRLGVHENPAVRDVFGMKKHWDVTPGEGFHVARVTGGAMTTPRTPGTTRSCVVVREGVEDEPCAVVGGSDNGRAEFIGEEDEERSSDMNGDELV